MSPCAEMASQLHLKCVSVVFQASEKTVRVEGKPSVLSFLLFPIHWKENLSKIRATIHIFA